VHTTLGEIKDLCNWFRSQKEEQQKGERGSEEMITYYRENHYKNFFMLDEKMHLLEVQMKPYLDFHSVYNEGFLQQLVSWLTGLS